jgi:Integrase core domain
MRCQVMVKHCFTTSDTYRAKNRLQLVHSDLMGPIEVISHGGKRFIMTFMDDHTRFKWVFFLRKKSNAFEAFKVWIQEVENKSGLKVKTFRTDNGGEY